MIDASRSGRIRTASVPVVPRMIGIAPIGAAAGLERSRFRFRRHRFPLRPNTVLHGR